MKRAAVVLIIENDLVLACSRKTDLNSFGLPGGKCEGDESFEIAAMRETFEETGYIISNLKFVFERQDGQFIVRAFVPEKYEGKILSEKEAIEKGEGIAKFVSKYELISGPFGKYNEEFFLKMGML